MSDLGTASSVGKRSEPLNISSMSVGGLYMASTEHIGLQCFARLSKIQGKGNGIGFICFYEVAASDIF